MAVIKPFQCIKPTKELAVEVAALPYDVYNREEAYEAVKDKKAKMLVLFIFIFDGPLQPIIAVEIHDDSALVKTMFAFKRRFHDKGKIFFTCLHL